MKANDLIDLIESNDLKSTYLKIKDWDAKALAGYARRVGVPDEVVDPVKRDKETLLGEILGHLFDDDWERDLMKMKLI